MISSSKKMMKAAALTAVAVVMTACAGNGALNVHPAIAPVPAGSERVLFKAPGLDEQSALRAQYQDNDQQEEYALFRGKDGAQAEVVSAVASFYGAGAAGGDRHVLDFAKITKQTVEMWNMPLAKRVTFTGDAFPYNGKLPYYLQPFGLAATGQNCVGFHTEFNRDAHDPKGAYDNQLFGYYCAPTGTKMAKQDMIAAVDGLDIAGITSRAPAAVMERTFRQLRNDPQLVQAVKQGAPTGTAGLPAFPLELVRIYSDELGGSGDKP